MCIAASVTKDGGPHAAREAGPQRRAGAGAAGRGGRRGGHSTGEPTSSGKHFDHIYF